MKQILAIDDDTKLTDLLTEYLRSYQFDVTSADLPSKGFQFLKKKKFDLIILDIMLPEEDGLSVLKKIRGESKIPVIMLTARGETTDRIIGLELGADDYLPKPFEPRELVARIQTILRRVEAESPGIAEEANSINKTTEKEADSNKDDQPHQIFLSNPPVPENANGLKIVKRSRQVFLYGGVLDLTSAEFDLLCLLASDPGKVWSRDEIMNELQGIDSDVFSRAIDISVSRLRQKLSKRKQNTNSKNLSGREKDLSSEYIKTIRGVGYCFVDIDRFDKGDAK